MTSRWDDLFADLEGQIAAHRRAELEGEVSERVRVERARIGLGDRLAAQLASRVTLRTVDGGRVDGTLRDVGADWVRLGQGRTTLLVPVGAVVTVAGLGPRSRPAEGDPGRRITWVTVLRELSRDRLPVRVCLTTGHVLEGRVDRVMSDHLDLAVGPDPRQPAVAETVPFAAVCWVGARED